jgi:hypothetical protein
MKLVEAIAVEQGLNAALLQQLVWREKTAEKTALNAPIS